MRPLIALLALAIAGCTAGPATDPNLSLHDRFVLHALTDDQGKPVDQLLKWSWPIRVAVVGDQTYYADVERQVAELGEITGLPAEMVDQRRLPGIIVTFGSRRELQAEADEAARRYGIDKANSFTCWFVLDGTPQRFRSNVFIRSDLSPSHIRRCISQEVTQSLGVLGDIDGRDDSVLTSFGGANHLTLADRQMLAVFYDNRLHSGMSRTDVLAILQTIVDDLKDTAENP